MPARALADRQGTAAGVDGRLLALVGLAAFLGPALLFLIEPMATKALLPVLGGSAAVSTSAWSSIRRAVSRLRVRPPRRASVVVAQRRARARGGDRRRGAAAPVSWLQLRAGGICAARALGDRRPSLRRWGAVLRARRHRAAPSALVDGRHGARRLSPLRRQQRQQPGGAARLSAAGRALPSLSALPGAPEPAGFTQLGLWCAGFLAFALRRDRRRRPGFPVGPSGARRPVDGRRRRGGNAGGGRRSRPCLRRPCWAPPRR